MVKPPPGAEAAEGADSLPVLNLNGVPTPAPPADGAIYFTYEALMGWIPNRGDRAFELEAVCIRIYDAFAAAIFEDLELYRALTPVQPQFLAIAGLNSECTWSRDLMIQMLELTKDTPYQNQFLYLHDCHKLVSGIQECGNEARILMGEFYRALNLDPVTINPTFAANSVTWNKSVATTKIIAMLQFVFIRLYSLLDYATKLSIESESLRSDFTT